MFTNWVDVTVGPYLLEAVSTWALKSSMEIFSPFTSATEEPTFPPEKLLLLNTPDITNANNAKPIIRIRTVVRFLIFSNIAILLLVYYEFSGRKYHFLFK
jgi:hypothetical protein